MKNALVVTHVSGFVPQFEMNNVKILQGMGYQVHYATNYNNPSYGTDNHRLDGTGIIRHQIDFVRSPFAISDNRKVYQQLKKLMIDIKFDLIHCHTPMGGAMARIVAKATNTKPVIYTVHGFHFYKGAPLMNWLVYYPAERFLSRCTDVLITINQEDYKRAQSFHSRKVQYIPGVGIITDRISNLKVDCAKKKIGLGIELKSKVVLSVGELIKRKNYETAIAAFAKAEIQNAVLVICGHGILENELKSKTEQYGITNKVIFLGYRNDIHEIMRCSDVFLFPSYQEGLSAALMEAMAAGLPVLCSNIRGNVDLIEQEQGGYCFQPNDIDGFAGALKDLIEDTEKCNSFGAYNRLLIEKYDIKYIDSAMKNIYNSVINNGEAK